MKRERAMIGRRNFLKNTAAAGAALGSFGLLGMPAVRAQEVWPNRPVKFIVPLAPGGGIDYIARAIGEYMSRHIDQPVVVENRTGAGGTVGMDMAMKSPPDGYTVLITNDSAASTPHFMAMSYDYTKVMLPVCHLGRHGQILATHSSLGVKSVKELVDYVKKNPGLGTATSGVGTNQHVILEWFKREADIKLDHVPYRGAGQAINDLVAGHVKTAFLAPTTLMPHAAAGTLHTLAQSTAKRSPILPNVPTIDESGYKSLILEAWFAAFAPAGTPASIIARLNAEMNKALKDQKLIDALTKGGIETVGGTPDELGKRARADSEKYARLMKQFNMQVGG